MSHTPRPVALLLNVAPVLANVISYYLPRFDLFLLKAILAALILFPPGAVLGALLLFIPGHIWDFAGIGLFIIVYCLQRYYCPAGFRQTA